LRKITIQRGMCDYSGSEVFHLREWQWFAHLKRENLTTIISIYKTLMSVRNTRTQMGHGARVWKERGKREGGNLATLKLLALTTTLQHQF